MPFLAYAQFGNFGSLSSHGEDIERCSNAARYVMAAAAAQPDDPGRWNEFAFDLRDTMSADPVLSATQRARLSPSLAEIFFARSTVAEGLEEGLGLDDPSSRDYLAAKAAAYCTSIMLLESK